MNSRKRFRLLLLFLIYSLKGQAQTPDQREFRNNQLEAQAEKTNVEPEDDSYEMELSFFSRHPLNLNNAKEEDLIQLHIPDILQVKNFLSYRDLLGPLVSIHELQAVPGWDMETIRRIIPYVMVGRDESLYSAVKERWKGGDASFLIRAARVIEKSRGYTRPSGTGASYYEGSAEKIFMRYTYNYKQLLAYGFTGEKDAGEPFYKGERQLGFDFYSFHFFLQQKGLLRSLAIGDFTVNLGQGLIQWQTFSFTKSSQALAIKREASILKPYHSAGEFNFHRGLGISLQKRNWQTTLFISFQKISSNLETDTSGREDHISSFQNSGYHRTPAEIADRNNSRQFSAGGNIRYGNRAFSVGFNWIDFRFSRHVQKANEPYNLYNLKVNHLADYSFDYCVTHGNLHFFGEFAADHRLHQAIVQGALISFGQWLDMALLYRNISPAYQSLYSDAFTENPVPNNENGLYTGLTFKPSAGLQADIYYDFFVFPWLKYRVDGPSSGQDFLMQLIYQPDKGRRLALLYKNEVKSGNVEVFQAGTNRIENSAKKRVRIETDYSLSRTIRFTGRMEVVWASLPKVSSRQGFLGMAAFAFGKSGFSVNAGAAIFETDDYDTRIYTYEPDLLYNFSLPSFYGRGLHYYMNLHGNLSRLIPGVGKRFRLTGWIKWGQTFYPGANSIGTGLDEIPGNRKSEIKAQVLVQWQ